MNAKPSLIVFSDDWGRHPSSCQHLVSHLLDRFDVTWVNTIGMRRPSLDMATIRRGFEKISQWSSGKRSERTPELREPEVESPLMWPSFASNWSRAVNRRLLSRHLRRRLTRLESGIVLTTIPVVADLIGRLPVARWIYYCVDDFSEWPGLDSATLREMEEQLIQGADEIVAAGDNLAERIESRGRRVRTITHGVDLQHWSQAGERASGSATLSEIEPPLALFWGLVDRRLDIDWLRTLSERMTRGSIVLVGPQQDPDPALQAIPRLRLTGPVSYKSLPQLASAAQVLIMPYADLPVTRAMQPLKLKEYLATGKPVVARRLPAVIDWETCLDAVVSDEDFAVAVEQRFAGDLPCEQRDARARLADESWSAKAENLASILLAEPELEMAW